MTTPDDPPVPEVPDTKPVYRTDLTAEIERIAAERIARVRHSNRIRAAHRQARLIGITRRNVATVARNLRQAAQREVKP